MAAGDVVVTDKTPETTYYIYTRIAAKNTTEASAASEARPFTTLKGVAASQFSYTTTETVYTGSANPATVTFSVHSSGQFTLKYDGSTTVPTNAGEYTLTAEVTTHDGYAAATVDLGKWTIKPLEVTLTWANYTDRAYDGNASNVTASINNIKNSDDVRVNVTDGNKTDVGDYTAKATGLIGAKAGNYTLPTTTPTQAYKITEATITVGTDAFTAYSGEYDGNAHSITVDTSKNNGEQPDGHREVRHDLRQLHTRYSTYGYR